jgi:phage-related protein
LTVANLGGEISALLLIANTFTPGNDLGGAVVTRIRTLKKYLDGEAAADPNARFPLRSGTSTASQQKPAMLCNGS